MKQFILSAVFLASTVGLTSAQACSYFIDEKSKSEELKQVALASLGTVTVNESNVEGFSFFESKPTPMCPKEMTYNATVNVNYDTGFNTCTVALTVKKVEPWTEGGSDTYTVTGRQTARCTK